MPTPKRNFLAKFKTLANSRRWQVLGAAACCVIIVSALILLFSPAQKYQPSSTSNQQSVASPTPSETPNPTPSPSVTPTATVVPTAQPTQSRGQPKLKYFSASDFVTLYYSLRLPNTDIQTQAPAIYGDAAADAHIQQLAQSQGYKLQPVASGSLVSIQGQQLQSSAAQAWTQLQNYAQSQGISLGLISGYRSLATQRSLFIGSLSQEGQNRIGRDYTVTEIAQDTADAAINSILAYRSIPGYSKHHTGYVMDITDLGSGQDFTSFRNTAGYKWITSNNYEPAKKFGFIPSYPEGATNMGPNPEAWEFIFVGTQYTYQ